MQVDSSVQFPHQLLHKPLRTGSVLQGQWPQNSHADLIFAARFLWYCNQAEVIRHVQGWQPAWNTSFLNNFSGYPWADQPRRRSAVKGVSRYIADISVFLRRASWCVIVRRIGKICTQARQATVGRITMFWSELIGVMEKGGSSQSKLFLLFFFFWQFAGLRHQNRDQNDGWDTNGCLVCISDKSLSLQFT